MWNTKMQKKGQALIELAVFGMIALMALGFMIRIGLRINYNQEAKMAAFRKAESLSYGQPNARAVDVYQGSARQIPDPADEYMAISRERAGGGAYAEWSPKLTYANKNISSRTVLVGVAADNTVSPSYHTDMPESAIVNSSTMTNSGGATSTQDNSGTSLNSSTSASFGVSGPYGGSGSSPSSGFSQSGN
jgi:hypothetical protein